jgi:hypothetical protein
VVGVEAVKEVSAHGTPSVNIPGEYSHVVSRGIGSFLTVPLPADADAFRGTKL